MKMENSMEKRIEEQLDGLTKEEIAELILDNCQTTQIEGLTDEFKNLISLSLINCGLTSLKGVPSLPELARLELSDNKLSGTLNLLVTSCPKLTHLHLGGNKFKELDALEPLKELSELKKLDLFNCEITEVDGFRDKVFEMLPQIIYLDGINASGEEDEEEDDENEGESGSEEEEGEEGSEEEEDEVGLSYLQKSGLEEESDGEDFQPNGTNEDDEEEEDEEEDEMEEELGEEAERESPAVPRGRGIKRKRATEEENGAAGEKTSKSTTEKSTTAEVTETTPAEDEEQCNGE